MSVEAIPLKNIHHVEIYAGNAKQAAYYYRKAFGFSQIAYSGPETGDRERARYVLAQGKIRLMITTPLQTTTEMTAWLAKHGDGVRDIAFQVDDADAAYNMAIERGAVSVDAPHDHVDDHGKVRHACVQTYGDTVHSFFSKQDYAGPFLPLFQAKELKEEDTGLLVVDHIVGNVEDHQMNHWKEYYENVFGWHQFLSFDDKDISTEFTALRSVVMSNPNGLIKFPINEPADGKKKSQIQEYVEFNNGPGAQHVAMLTGDIIKTVTALRARGVDFLEVPDTYYDDLKERVPEVEEEIEALRKLRILVDCDDKGYLLQLFTKPVEDRPTLFYEIIQRKGAQGFGKGNFKALFESIEREQGLRGNL